MTEKVIIRTYQVQGKDYFGKYEVHFWGLTRYDIPALVRVMYTPSVFCVLPNDIEWNERVVDRLFRRIGEMLERAGHKPHRHQYKKARPLYRSHEREDDCLVLYFRSFEAAQHCSNLLKKPREYFRGEEFQITVVEHSIDTVVKLLADKEADYVAWIKAKGQLLSKDNSKRVTKEPYEYLCEVDDFKQLSNEKTKDWKLPTPAVLTFDIEANAENIFAMPKPLNPKDAVFMIGVKFENAKGKRKSYILTFVDISPIEGAKIIKYKTEYAMLNGFTDMVNKCNPDSIIGHNIIGFDQIFMDKRLRNIHYRQWRNFSRYLDYDCKLISIEWESSAYAKMEMYYLDCPGRLILDTLFILRKTQRLESYKLDFVAKTFLGFGKLKGDESIEEVIERTEKWKKKNKEKKKQAIAATKTADEEENNDDEEDDEEDYMTAHELFEYYRSGNPDNLKKAAIYCWGDCHATHEVFKELNIWVTITQLAAVVFVDPFMIVTRGQQVRTLNQVYRQCVKDGKYVNREKASDIPFSGGSVIKPVPGLYKNIIVDDFTGLYPSIMRAYNISYDTYVKEGSYFIDITKGETVPDVSDVEIPDEDCIIAEWEEDIDMEKLKKKRKAKTKVIKELEESTNDDAPVKGRRKKKEDIHHFKCRTRWLKKEGIMSRIARQISEARAAVKKIMATTEKGTYAYMILNTTQEAQKVSNNSLFGGLGAKDGKLPLMEGAATITAMARKAIGRVGRYYRKKFGATIVYGDTDSAMVSFPEDFDFGGNIIAFGRKVAADITTELFADKKPMNLEMEKVLARFFIKGPKMYGYKQYNEDLTVNPVAVFKGLMNARRDNPVFLRNLASEVLINVMDELPFKKVVRHLTGELVRMIAYQSVSEKEMTVTQKIGSSYKSQTNALHIYSKHLLASGKTIQGGDRMPFLFVKIPQENIQGKKIYVGNKMELPELRRKTKAPIDYLYYLQKRCALFNDIMHIAYDEEKFVEKLVKQFQAHTAVMRQIRVHYNYTVDTVGINKKSFYPRYTLEDRISEINYALRLDRKYVNPKYKVYVTVITIDDGNDKYSEKVRIRHNKTVTDIDFDTWDDFIHDLLSE